MNVPAACHGTYRRVRSRLRSLPKRLSRGQRFVEAVGEAGMLNSAETDGLLLLHGPSPLLGGLEAFQLFLPHLLVRKALLEGDLAEDVASAVFAESLDAAWTVLGLLSLPNTGWLATDEECRRVLVAACAFWAEIDVVGPRYSTGLPVGQRLWEAKGNLPKLLVRCGFPRSVLDRPLPHGGLPQLVERKT